jgi:hypothetical protein
MDVSDKENQASMADLPADVKETAKGFIRQAFELFTGHTKRLAEELADFNKHQAEVRERIKRGARRTDGRVI